jgi:hypothetical protein
MYIYNRGKVSIHEILFEFDINNDQREEKTNLFRHLNEKAMSNEIFIKIIANSMIPNEFIDIYEIVEDLCSKFNSKSLLRKFIHSAITKIYPFEYEILVTKQNCRLAKSTTKEVCHLKHNNLNIFITKVNDLYENWD